MDEESFNAAKRRASSRLTKWISGTKNPSSFQNIKDSLDHQNATALSNGIKTRNAKSNMTLGTKISDDFNVSVRGMSITSAPTRNRCHLQGGKMIRGDSTSSGSSSRHRQSQVEFAVFSTRNFGTTDEQLEEHQRSPSLSRKTFTPFSSPNYWTPCEPHTPCNSTELDECVTKDEKSFQCQYLPPQSRDSKNRKMRKNKSCRKAATNSTINIKSDEVDMNTVTMLKADDSCQTNSVINKSSAELNAKRQTMKESTRIKKPQEKNKLVKPMPNSPCKKKRKCRRQTSKSPSSKLSTSKFLKIGGLLSNLSMASYYNIYP